MPTAIIPDSVHETTFRALTSALKADPTLRGPNGVKTWSDRCGRAADVADPTVADCPWVRLSLLVLPAAPHTRISIAQPAKVLVETAVAGANAGASARLSDALNAAIFGPSAAAVRLRAEVRNAGAAGIGLRSPALPTKPEDYGTITRGEGELELSIFIRTR